VTCIVTNLFIIKPTRCTNFPNLLRHETLHVSDSSSAHRQEFIHCTIGTEYVIQVWRELSSSSAYFVILYCRICFVQFLSGVSMLTYPLCLFGIDEFYVHVTVHRKKFIYNKTNQMHQFPKFTPAWNSTCFGQFLCPSSGVYSLYTRHWYMSYMFVGRFRAGPG
jgi:hypothetical protein